MALMSFLVTGLNSGLCEIEILSLNVFDLLSTVAPERHG